MILLFGAQGQLGQELVRLAREKELPLVGLARNSGDIADPEFVRSQVSRYRPDVVVNAAAYTDVDRAEDCPDSAIRSNILGPSVLASICGAVPLIHISTDYVFDGKKADPYTEADLIAPLNVYGRTKAEGEAAVMKAADRYVILRTSWLYSEFSSNFLKTIISLCRNRDELQVVDDQYGCPTSARSLAEAILNVAPRIAFDKDVVGIYHFAGLGSTSRYGFASCVVNAQKRLTGRCPVVKPISSAVYVSAAQRPSNTILDTSKYARVFGFRPVSWEAEVELVTTAVVAANRK